MSLNCGYIPKDDPSYNFIRAERFIDNCALILSECLKNKENKEMTEKTAFNMMKEENFNFDVKDVISWSNNHDATQYIGHKGYFGDSLTELDLAVYNGNSFTLNAVSVGVSQCFYSIEREKYFGFFLPEDKAKEVEREEKYRPFTVDEIGVICMSYYRFRNKKTKDEYMGMLTGVIRKSTEK